MTDRLHSCRESPSGRHAPIHRVTDGQPTIWCQYCGRLIPREPAAADVHTHDTRATFHGGEQ